MKTNKLLIILIAIILISCNKDTKKEEVISATIEVKQEKEEVKEKVITIYEKLGGEAGVSDIVDDIIDQHLKNESINHYFIPLKENPEYYNKFKQHVKDFLSSGTGGEVEYKGRDMSTTHKGLNLSEADFLHAIDDILLVLDTRKVDRESRNEILATLYSMKASIIKQ